LGFYGAIPHQVFCTRGAVFGAWARRTAAEAAALPLLHLNECLLGMKEFWGISKARQSWLVAAIGPLLGK